MVEQDWSSPSNVSAITFSNVRSFTFFSAIECLLSALEHDTNEDMLAEQHVEGLYIRCNPSLGFPRSELESVGFTRQKESVVVEVMVNFMGLHGSGSPLPGYLLEAACSSHNDDGALHELFDFFSGRLAWLLFLVLRKSRYERRYKTGAVDLFSGWLLSFSGLRDHSLRTTGYLQGPKLLAILGHLLTRGQSATSVAAIVGHCLGLEHVWVRDFQLRNVCIPGDQRMILGIANSSLGRNSSIGMYVPSLGTKITVIFNNLSLLEFESLLPHGARFQLLRNLLMLVISSPVSVDLELCVSAENVPYVVLGQPKSACLGRNSFLGGAGSRAKRAVQIQAIA